MATNAGLTRFSPKTNLWKHYTRANGLPSNQLSALAIDSLGHIYLGTQSEGIAIAKPDDDYRNWQIVRRDETTPFPNTSAGSGLPSNLINDILVADDDTVYAATTCGLVRSKDFGENWTYLRGADWEDKLKGLYAPIAPQPPTENLNRELLREDYVTCLAEDEKGLLWLGYRQKGLEIRRPLPDRVPFISAKNAKDRFPYVSAILPLPGGAALVAAYGDGLSAAPVVPAYTPDSLEREELAKRRGWKTVVPPTKIAPLPIAASVPTTAELQALLKEAENVPAVDGKAPIVVPLAEDWTTQGDWLGRYGRYWADLCAMCSPEDHVWGAGGKVAYRWSLGPNRAASDSVRYWVHWLQTDNKRVLEMPPVYADSRLVKGLTTPNKLRRQSEVDDHGESYPMSKDGPHLRLVLQVPPGDWILSLYNHNKDGHAGMNRMRDYLIGIRPHDPKLAPYDTSDWNKQPELGRSRQRDFWGGVYQKFLVQGPQELTLEVNRNYSFNTIMAAVFLDTLEEEPFPYFNLNGGLNEQTTLPQLRTAALTVALPQNETAEALWQTLEKMRNTNPSRWMAENRVYYAALTRYYENARLRTVTAEMPILWMRLGICYRALNLMDKWEETQRRRGLVPAREIEHALKWDGQWEDRGRGFEYVAAYSTARAGLDALEKSNNQKQEKKS